MKVTGLRTASVLFVLAALIWLAVAIGLSDVIDRTLSLALVSPSSLVAFFSLVTTLGDFWPRMGLMAVAMALLWLWGDRAGALYLPAMLIPGMLLVSGLKLAIARPRPDLIAPLDHVTSASFPSGHAANNMMLYLGFALVIGRGWGAALVLAGIMGWSRVALGVHWPSDVAAGWCIGAGWALLCFRLLAEYADSR